MSSPRAPSITPVQRRPRVRKSIAHVPSSELDQENAGHLNLTTDLTSSIKSNATSRKSRSKSLGPGGLDALKETSGNRRRSAANSFQPKSILKPTIPLSPIRAIPARKTSRKDGNASSAPTSPAKQAPASDEKVPDTPARAAEADADHDLKQQSQNDKSQDELADASDETDRRKRKAEIQKQRDARRKSMAGRRVSFAPEATLHTWDTEVLQDSTTSTGSAESTRRASSFARSKGAETERPGTPPDQVEEDAAKKLPERQRDAHKKHRRRSSGIPPMNFNDPDTLSSSPFSGSSGAGEDMDSVIGSPSPCKDAVAESGEGTMATIDESDKNDEDLDASLEDAATRAGTRTLDRLDENGDVSMDIAGDEVTAAFKPWVKQSMGTGSPHPGKAAARMNQENVNIFSPTEAAERGSPTPSHGGDDDMSMDMTQAMGGILRGDAKVGSQPGERYPKRRKSVATRRRSSDDASDRGDGTMDLSAAVGGIQKPSNLADLNPNLVDENEELSMEFTSVFGAVKGRASPVKKGQPPNNVKFYQKQNQLASQPGDLDDDGRESDMEMTEAVGSIQDPKPRRASSDESVSCEKPIHHTKQRMESEIETASSSMRSKPAPRPRPSIGASATGSPAADPFARRDRLRRSGNGGTAATPERKPTTPTKQLTPVLANERPTTPGKTPPSSAVAMRKTTPKKLFQEEIRANKSPQTGASSLFRPDSLDGQQTPNIVLAPKHVHDRRSSVLANDDVQNGSPRMAAILDRRTSISDNADIFAPKGPSRGVKFEDPRAMEAEVSKERDDDHRRESGQFIMEREADGEGEGEEENATQTLKEMMQSMTPKKSNTKSKGRKSLAVGSAKGLLGKRPAELDDDEEDSPHTFGKATSPVKRIRLQGPPSAEETMRSSRGVARPLSNASGNARPQTPNTGSPPGQKTVTTPRSQGRFRDAENPLIAQKPVPTMGQTDPVEAESDIKDGSEEHIGLQDFLNLTNIRFMELTTTKRRPTAAPAAFKDGERNGEEGSISPAKQFEDAVVAGACTLPMLELFQHSCRELKKYISEGRSVVKEIEAETIEENPPIFKEYTAAKPSDRAALDNQFKNMKTNARLLSKATWYEWRMKLLEGVRESLKETSSDLQDDSEALEKQLSVIEAALTEGQEKRSALEREHGILQARADELAGCDPEDLETARERLTAVTQDIESHSHGLEEHMESMQGLDEEIEALRQAKQEAQAATKEAQRQREECRGWSTAEVKKVQARVDDLVASTGWRIVAANGSRLTLEMDEELILSFNNAAYLPAVRRSADSVAASPALSLVYSPKNQRGNSASQEPSTTQRFFLQLLRAHLHALAPSQTHASMLLRVVASGWELARLTEGELKRLRRRSGITNEHIAGDEKLIVDTSLLLPASQSKMNVTFAIVAVARGEEIEAGVGVSTNVAYGREYRKSDVDKILQKRLIKGLRELEEKEGNWAECVEALKGWLVKH